MYYETKGEKFIDDPGYVEAYIVAASSELPCPSCPSCPSCLTALMQIQGEVKHDSVRYDQFHCGCCDRRVLIERFAS